MQSLNDAVTEAAKCANVANQLVSKKVRTRWVNTGVWYWKNLWISCSSSTLTAYINCGFSLMHGMFFHKDIMAVCWRITVIWDIFWSQLEWFRLIICLFPSPLVNFLSVQDAVFVFCIFLGSDTYRWHQHWSYRDLNLYPVITPDDHISAWCFTSTSCSSHWLMWL